MSKLNKHMKSDKIKWIVITIALLLVSATLVGVCLQIFGRDKQKPSKWFTKSDNQIVKPVETADKGSYYLVGTMNDWKWSKDYRFKEIETSGYEPNQIAQYSLRVDLDKNTDVKIWKGTDDYQYNNCTNETGCGYCVHSYSTHVTTITQSGTYEFYLKFYEDGGNSFYVAKVETGDETVTE